MQPGGSAANTACWLASQGVPVGFFGYVGDDTSGKSFAQSLASNGVKSHLQLVTEQSTGSCVCLVDASGERTMVPDAGANLAFRSRDLDDELLGRYQHLHLSAYPLLRDVTKSAVVEMLARARDKGMTISVDPASSAPIIEFGANKFLDSIGEIDLILPDEQEATALTGLLDPKLAAQALVAFARTVIVKLGQVGALGVTREGEISEVAAVRAGVVDTTGAGDAFAAGFLECWLRKGELRECLARGVELAQVCVQNIGGRPQD